MSPLVEANHLHKRFGELRAVAGVSLAVAPGEAYGLVGPDGAGKTTTLRMLVGALTPDDGRVTIAGYDLQRATEHARAHLGYLPQRFSLYGDLTVAENLRFFGQVRGMKGADLSRRAAELLRFVGLDGFEARRSDQLSGGMKQKLGLACALIHRPRVLLLDEPTGGVDPVTRQDFWQLIIRVLAEGAAVLVSTPYMDEAARCTRVGFMTHGTLLVEGAPRELTGRLAGRVLELSAQPRNIARATALAEPGVEDVMVFGDRFHLRVQPGAAERVAARLPVSMASAGATVERLRPAAPSLEDVFISLLQSSADAGRPAM